MHYCRSCWSTEVTLCIKYKTSPLNLWIKQGGTALLAWLQVGVVMWTWPLQLNETFMFQHQSSNNIWPHGGSRTSWKHWPDAVALVKLLANSCSALITFYAPTQQVQVQLSFDWFKPLKENIWLLAPKCFHELVCLWVWCRANSVQWINQNDDTKQTLLFSLFLNEAQLKTEWEQEEEEEGGGRRRRRRCSDKKSVSRTSQWSHAGMVTQHSARQRGGRAHTRRRTHVCMCVCMCICVCVCKHWDT